MGKIVKYIDLSFGTDAISDLWKMMDKKLLFYLNNPRVFFPRNYSFAALSFEDNNTFLFSDFKQELDYFGDQKEVGVFKLKRISTTFADVLLNNIDLVETPVEKTVVGIKIINETQKLFVFGQETCEIILTRGVILEFEDGQELSIEKGAWFTEHVMVRQGENLIDTFIPTEKYATSWKEPYHIEYSRKIITLSNRK